MWVLSAEVGVHHYLCLLRISAAVTDDPYMVRYHIRSSPLECPADPTEGEGEEAEGGMNTVE